MTMALLHVDKTFVVFPGGCITITFSTKQMIMVGDNTIQKTGYKNPFLILIMTWQETFWLQEVVC